jgi:hypothetical protein
VRLVRQHERERRDEVRRAVQQHFALRQRFAHEPEFELLEVAQPAVDKLRAPLRRRAGDVLLLDQHDAQTAARGIARDARAVDAGADNGEVVGSFASGSHGGLQGDGREHSTARPFDLRRSPHALPSRFAHSLYASPS